MALVINDRVRETTTVTGTGSATLLGAVTGYQSFSVIGNGNTTYYTIADQGGPNWEVGLGTWSTGGTLARTTVLASSNSGSLVNFTTGTKDVFVTYPSENAVYTSNGPGTSGYVLVSAGSGAASVWTAPTSIVGGAGGSNTQVQYNSSGSLAGSANLTFNGTTLTTANDASISGLTVGKGGGAISSNTALGSASLAANTTGTENTGVGQNALKAITTGTTSTAVGDNALQAVTTGTDNTAVGSAALYATTGSYNIAMGRFAGYSNTTGSNISALGFQSLFLNTTGSYNTAVGTASLYSNTTASNNTAVGYQAGYSNTTGTPNTAFGTQAGYANQTGSSNTAIGTYALQNNTVNNNTGIGHAALNATTTGQYNTAIGSATLQLNTTASSNTAVGYQAGYSNTTGGPINAFGYQALYLNTTGTNNDAFGYQALGNNTTGGGNVGIGRGALFANTTGNSNIAIGQQALVSNTTASNNTAVGYQAGYSNTTGANNNAVGYLSLYSNTTGSNNNAFGTRALYSNTTADNNQAFGHYALTANTTGTANTAIGQATLLSNTIGSSNVAVGKDALQANTTASNNTAVGYQAGYIQTTADRNAILGTQAGYAGTTGSANAYVGYQTGYANTTGYLSAALGAYALASCSTGVQNTAIGAYALNVATGSNNVAVGKDAGVAVTTGTLNALIGLGAGYAITTGSKNTIIGAYGGNQGGLDIRTASNYIVLSDGDGNPRQIIDSSGNVGIGTSSPAQKLDVNGSAYFGPGISTGTGLTTGDASFELGGLRTGSGVAYIDIHSTSGSDYEARIIRNSGTNGSLQIINTGTGDFQLQASGAAPMIFQTSATERMRIDSSGNVGIGTTTPQSLLTVYGPTGVTSDSTGEATGVGTIRITNGSSALSSAGGLEFKIAGDSNGYGSKIQALNSAGSQLVFAGRQGSGTWSEYMRIDSGGNLLVGQTINGYVNGNGIALETQSGPNGAGVLRQSHVNGTGSGASYTLYCYNTSPIGSVAQSGTTAVLYNTTSDYRLKTDITPIQNALTTIGALNPISFTWVDGRPDDGFLAHELQAVIPNCITGEKDAVNEDGTPNYQQMDSSGVIPFLVKAIQELNAKVDAQAAEIDTLKRIK